MIDERILARLAAMIEKADVLLKTYQAPPSGFIGFEGWVDTALFAEWRTQSLLLVRQAFGETHTYAKAFEEATVKENMPSSVNSGKGILTAAREDVADGNLFDVRSLVAAEIFTEFLDMASHLAQQGFKDAAASLAGAVLEDGLRKIAVVKEVEFKARDGLDDLNTKLAAANVYNEITKARVNSWRVLRNAADHGNFAEYDAIHVREMVTGVMDFLGAHLG